HDVGKAIDKLDASDERRARALEFTAFIRESGLTARRIDELTGTNMGGHFTTAASQPAVATADLFDLLRPHLPEVPERIEGLVRQRTVESMNFAARELLGTETRMNEPSGIVNVGQGERVAIERKITAPATPEAAQWDGWGTALKPAFEPIVLARKALAEKTVARNVLAYGTGAINVDACRIATDENLNGGSGHGAFRLGGCHTLDELKALAEVGANTPDGRNTAAAALARALASKERMGEYVQPSGRWPANVLLDHHAAAWVDEQSGTLKTGAKKAHHQRHTVGGNGLTHGRMEGVTGPESEANEGGASRFFYTAKAPKLERPNVNGVQHPTVKPLAIMQWLIRLVTPPGGTVLDPFAGSGTTI